MSKCGLLTLMTMGSGRWSGNGNRTVIACANRAKEGRGKSLR